MGQRPKCKTQQIKLLEEITDRILSAQTATLYFFIHLSE